MTDLDGLDEKDRSALDRMVSELQQQHSDALLAVLLTGEAASADYRPAKTRLTTLVLLGEVTPEALRRTRGSLKAWSKRRIATPLFMDPLYVESALDVFPIELLEIGDRHLLLHGESDPFADLEIHLPHLRLEVEEQLRGKMLHLWEAYLEVGASKRELKRLLVESPLGFEVALRGLLRLRQEAGARRPDDSDALLAAVETEFGVALPTLRRLEAVRGGKGSIAGDEVEPLFDIYLAEVRSLVRTIDGL
ncbi:MAG: hypothetical protein JRG96_00765 [Deltaproteobacteria bacterium]|nr:hypothetical protein [Deltaproteobacteria bacterium]MBW2417189.1 hypothetical protein [Deltaproteobacteria bacterium]